MNILLAETETALRRLILTYARGADRLDPALVRSVFAHDAEIDLGAIYRGGPDGFVDVVLGFMGAMAATRHQVGNFVIALDGPGRAAMESYVAAWHRIDADGGIRILEVFGRYLTRAEQRNGEWLIVYHSELIDWGEERPASSVWFDKNREMEKGQRDRGDSSYRFLPGAPLQ